MKTNLIPMMVAAVLALVGAAARGEATLSLVDPAGQALAVVDPATGGVVAVRARIDAADGPVAGFDAEIALPSPLEVVEIGGTSAALGGAEVLAATNGLRANCISLDGGEPVSPTTGAAMLSFTVRVPAGTPEGRYEVGLGPRCGIYADGTSNTCAVAVAPFAVVVASTPPVPCWDPAGGGTTNVCASYTPYVGQDTLTSGWYVVDGVFPDVARIAVSGDVNLLLMDHAELFATNGIRVAAEGGVTNRLTIWAQSDATAANSPAGRLVATGTDVCAGIGGDREHPDAGAITVNGGVVLASGVGPFKVSGADAGQLTDLRMASGGYALGNKWYYGIHAYADGFGGLQYAITVYSDSARTNAVATSEKMLGGGSLEMRRSIVITDPYAMGAAAYGYTTTTNEATGEFILNILDDTGAIAAKAVGAAGANCNIVAANGGANIGTVTFGLTDMTAGDTGTIYMANMRWGWNLPAGGTTIPMATTVQGRARARNNGIGVYGAKIAFDGSVHLGDSPTTGTDSPSYGTFDACGSGAGVGGGFNGAGGMVAIAGGAARAIACENGEAVGHGRNGADAGALSIDGIRVGYVGDDGEVHDWASVDERDDHCRNTNGVAVRLEVCFPHEFGGTDCKRCGAPAPTVSDVVARQRWPWNGYVDVDYELGGTTKGFAARISFAEQGGAGRVWVATNFLADARPSAEPGPHRATWDTKTQGVTNVVAAEVVAIVSLVLEWTPDPYAWILPEPYCLFDGRIYDGSGDCPLPEEIETNLVVAPNGSVSCLLVSPYQDVNDDRRYRQIDATPAVAVESDAKDMFTTVAESGKMTVAVNGDVPPGTTATISCMVAGFEMKNSLKISTPAPSAHPEDGEGAAP